MIDNRIIEDDYKIKLFIKQFEDTIHDIKTPISIIYIIAQDLELSGDLPESLKGYALAIKKYCNTIFNLLNEINDSDKVLGNSFKPRLSDCNIVSLTDDIIMSAISLAARKNVSVTFDANTEEKIITIDKNLYERIILNLISNAIKFTPENGYVDIMLTDNGDNVTVDIIDNGTGFDDNETAQIFNRYATKRTDYNKDGTGIGLAIVKEMVEVLGGRIKAKNCPSHNGATFSVTLPSGSMYAESEVFSSTAGFYQTKLI